MSQKTTNVITFRANLKEQELIDNIFKMLKDSNKPVSNKTDAILYAIRKTHEFLLSKDSTVDKFVK
jgi:thiamine monophosphate kinase